jgi:thermostable 8-oxoguanine DNA glycosylase
MIDASNITNFDLTDLELENHIMFWIFAAGKNGTRAAKVVNDLRAYWDTFSKDISTFNFIMHYEQHELVELLKDFKTGCHNHKAKSLSQLSRADLNLRTCSAEDLEKIYGIGMKTSRCFILHSRKDAEYAGLDTHMLKYLTSLGYDVPKTTPNNRKQYLTIEKIVINLARESGKSLSDFDLGIWNTYKVSK